MDGFPYLAYTRHSEAELRLTLALPNLAKQLVFGLSLRLSVTKPLTEWKCHC